MGPEGEEPGTGVMASPDGFRPRPPVGVAGFDIVSSGWVLGAVRVLVTSDRKRFAKRRRRGGERREEEDFK